MKKKKPISKKLKREGRPKRYKRLAPPAWYTEGLNDWPTGKILEQLRQEGLPMDEITFRSDAASYPDPGEMADRWEGRVDRDPGRWRDFFQLAARELWKRLLPDRDQFDWFIDDWEIYLERLKERPEKKITEADIPELLKLMDRLDNLLNAMSHKKGVNLHDCLMEVAHLYNYGLRDWLIELPFELAGDGFVDQAAETARRYSYIAPATFMGDLGWILAEAGRCPEAIGQVEENLKNFADDPWISIKAGDAADLCEQTERAEQLYLQALEMTDDGYTRAGAIQRLVPLYEQLGKPDEIENLKKKYPPDPDYEEVEEEQNQTADRDTSLKRATSKQPKIGRNDPCPCGSGKKYKKCCLPK